MPTFVVERYVPGISRADAEAVILAEARQADAMVSEGRSVRILHATLMEGDEAVMSVVEAPCRDDVVELGERSGAPADRIVPAIAVETKGAPTDGGAA